MADYFSDYPKLIQLIEAQELGYYDLKTIVVSYNREMARRKKKSGD